MGEDGVDSLGKKFSDLTKNSQNARFMVVDIH